jgi:hypothetical protein
LKDLDRPERLFQLDIDGLAQEFPGLRTVEGETAFAGREKEWLRRPRLQLAGRAGTGVRSSSARSRE